MLAQRDEHLLKGQAAQCSCSTCVQGQVVLHAARMQLAQLLRSSLRYGFSHVSHIALVYAMHLIAALSCPRVLNVAAHWHWWKTVAEPMPSLRTTMFGAILSVTINWSGK